MRQREAMAILEDRAKQNKRQPTRDIANEIAAENERLKQREQPKKYFDLVERFGTKAADYIVTERVEWIDLSANLLSAAQEVLNAWEHSKDAPSARSAMAEIRTAVGSLYGAVMDMDRKAREFNAKTTTTSGQ